MPPYVPPSESIGIPGVTFDALSGKAVPATALEWDNLLGFAGIGRGGPTSFWGFQEAASPAIDGNGINNLNAVVGSGGAIAWQQAVPDWSRVAVAITANGGDTGVSKQHGTLPDPSTNSYLALAYARVTATPNADWGLISILDSAFYAAIKQTKLSGATGSTAGQASAGSAPLPVGSVFPVVIKYDNTNEAVKIYTPYEVVSQVWAGAPGANTGEIVFGVGHQSGLASALAQYLLGALWTGPAAEWADSEIAALLTAMGWTVAWNTAPVADELGHYHPVGPGEWTALQIAPPLVTWNCQEIENSFSGSAINAAVGAELPLASTSNVTAGSAIAGSTRVGLQTTDAAAGPCYTTQAVNTSLLPNLATTSMALLVELKVNTVTHGVSPFYSWCFGIDGAQFISVYMTSGGVFGLYVNGTLTVGTVNQLGQRVLALLVYDVTNQRIVLYTPAEKITSSIWWLDTTGAGVHLGNSNNGGSVAVPGEQIMFSAAWKARQAEYTDAKARAEFQKLGWTVAW